MQFLYHSTSGTEDPTRATFSFMFARGALEAGHKPEIFLIGEATDLLRSDVHKSVQGVGAPPLSELLQAIKDNGVPVYV